MKKRGRKPILTDEQWVAVGEYYRQGHNLSEVARKFGINRSTLASNIEKKTGISIRPYIPPEKKTEEDRKKETLAPKLHQEHKYSRAPGEKTTNYRPEKKKTIVKI